MDHLFNAFIPRRTVSDHDIRQNLSCGDIPDLYTSKKRSLKKALFGRRRSASPCFERVKSNSELISSVDEQLMLIKEKLAAFREQDAWIRERMDSLNDSVSELASQSSLGSFTPSECSDLSSLDEAMQDEEEEEVEQQGGERAFSKQQTLCIPTIIVTECRDNFNQLPVRYFPMRRATSDSSTMNYLKVPEVEVMKRHITPSADQCIDLYPHYNNPEEISTLF